MSVDGLVLSEFTSIFESLRKCLELRDKYMTIAGHMLGFNPKDHDGFFSGLPDDISDVNGVRVDAEYHPPPPLQNPISPSNMLSQGSGSQSHALHPEATESPFEHWQIYPKPPPPHWHFR